MSREVRKVPANWQHPKNPSTGNYQPLLDASYEDAVVEWETEDLPEWLAGARLWADGLVKQYGGDVVPIDVVVNESKVHSPYRDVPSTPTYEWWAGDVPSRPKPHRYMPQWPDAERTHFMMYESVSEGTPISPAFTTAEELARWLVDNGASAFADQTATYEQWLRTIKRGHSAGSAVLQGGKWTSGVATT